MRTRRPEHLKAFDYLGFYRYFLTFCVHGRRSAFVVPEHVDAVLGQILRVAERERFAVIAYCFMRDHLHLLVEGLSDASDCRRFIARAKQLSGYHYQRLAGARLWQRYSYERTLRDDEAVLGVARYILENPLRAGLVTCATDYPFLGSAICPVEQILEAVQMPDGWRGSMRSG